MGRPCENAPLSEVHVVVCAVVVRSGVVGISTVFVLAADAALVDASGTFFNA